MFYINHIITVLQLKKTIFFLNYLETSALPFTRNRIIFFVLMLGKCPLLRGPISQPKALSAVTGVCGGDFPPLSLPTLGELSSS